MEQAQENSTYTINTQTSPPTNRKLPTVGWLLRTSIRTYRTQIRTILMIVVVPIIASIVQAISFHQENFFLAGIITLAAGLISFGSYLAFFAFVTGHAMTAKAAWKTAPRTILPVAMLHILVTLVCFGGFILFIIPGIILAITLSFSLFVFFAENVRGKEALVQSWIYVRGHWWGVFFRTFVLQCLWILLLIGIGILMGITSTTTETNLFHDILLVVVSNVIIVPINMLYMFELYRALKQTKQESDTQGDISRTRKYVTVFMIIGSLGIATLLGGLSYFVYHYSEFLLGLMKMNGGM